MDVMLQMNDVKHSKIEVLTFLQLAVVVAVVVKILEVMFVNFENLNLEIVYLGNVNKFK
jgi:hypothetical protein